MRNLRKRGVALILALALAISLAACGGGKVKFEIDENGFITWDPINRAVKYECAMVDTTFTNNGFFFLTEPGYQLEEGYSLHMRPVFANGSTGPWYITEYYGEGAPAALMGEAEGQGATDEFDIFEIDENGFITWDPIPDAVKYGCSLVDRAVTSEGEFFLTEPGYQLEEGYSLHMRPIFADGSAGDWYVSEYYGEGPLYALAGENGLVDTEKYVSPYFDVRWDQLECFELISAIRWDSVRTENGLLYFEADGPHGVMRFEAEGVTAQNGELTFQPGAQIWGLDAIGRICAIAPRLSDTGDPANYVYFSGGYTFTQETSVDSHEELMYVWGVVDGVTWCNDSAYKGMSMMEWQANFIIFGNYKSSPDAFSLSALEIYYDTATFNTGIRYMDLDTEFYGLYFEKEQYDPAREVYDLDAGILTFYLMAVPELKNEVIYYDAASDPDKMSVLGRSITAFTNEQFKTGDLRLADGTPVDKTTRLEKGMTLDVTVGDYTYPVELPVNEQFHGAKNLNQLVPYGYPEASGDMNAILIPVAWQDQPEAANDEKLLALKGEVGRVIENGTVTDYSQYISDDSRFSLSRYFDIASYGKLNISTFVTDWFVAPFNYSEYKDKESNDETFREAAYKWLMETYPDMDWTQYDKDGNGFFDAIMFVNVGTSDDDGYYPLSFSGGVYHLLSYNGGNAGTSEKPTINGLISVNETLLDGNVLIHEFGHNLGLIDYYDVTYSGIDAVGRFDMQSGNLGDWNPYSKYAAGWIEPTVVDLKPGETKEYTIGAFSDTGDALVIPVHGDTFDGPFNEYIMVDLFTDGGTNAYDAAEYYLDGVSGVRIYHIDARMETHVEEVNGVQYPLGTPNKVNAYDPSGIHQVELIQAGGDNTFTDLSNLRTTLSEVDLFGAGATFTMERYSEFFNDGKMDDGSDFPYTIRVVSVSEEKAVIRVTADQ